MPSGTIFTSVMHSSSFVTTALKRIMNYCVIYLGVYWQRSSQAFTLLLHQELLHSFLIVTVVHNIVEETFL